MNEPQRRSDRPEEPEVPEGLLTSPSLLGRVLANEPAAWNQLVGLYAPWSGTGAAHAGCSSRIRPTSSRRSSSPWPRIWTSSTSRPRAPFAAG